MSADPVIDALELAAHGLTPVADVAVSIAAGFPANGQRTGRVLVEIPAGRMFTGDEARSLAGRLARAAEHLDRLLGAA